MSGNPVKSSSIAYTAKTSSFVVKNQGNWDRCYSALMQYIAEQGKTDVPAAYITEDGLGLGRWLRNIRTKHREGTLSRTQAEALEKIGISLETVQNKKWQSFYEKAKEYYEKHKNLTVPKEYVTDDGIKLGTWITSQRVAYITGALTIERIASLNAIGMSWKRYRSKWEQGYEAAKMFVDEGGDINSIPDGCERNGVNLKSWIHSQKNKQNIGKLEAEKKQRLEKLGIAWNSSEAHWNEGYRHAKAYADLFGHLKVPDKYVCTDGYKLKSWLNNQKTKYRNGKLTKAQFNRLKEIGFSW